MRWILGLPQALVPSPMWKFALLNDFMEKYQIKEELIFEQCPGNNGKIYEGAMLGVARRGRGKGLGDKLVKHALHFAREAGCSHAHACTSGKFSQAIFKKNGFEVYFEKNYSDWKDKNGKVIIQHEIHTSAQINVLKL